MVLCTLRAEVTDHVGETVALPCHSVTGGSLWVSAQNVAGALRALAVDSVTEVSLLTSLAPLALREEEALQTLSGQSIAVPLRVGIPVIRAVARLALAPRKLRVPEEIVSADVAPVPGIAVLAVTDGLALLLVKVASLGVAVSAGPSVRTSALSAWHLVLTELRGSVVSNLALLTEVSHGVVPTVDTDSGLWVAGVRMAVTLALPAVGKVPEAWLALAAPPAKGRLLSVTETVPGIDVAELILRAQMVTVARLTARPSEPECCRGAGVTLSAHHQSLAVTAPVVLVTEDGGAPSVVTATRPLPGALVNQQSVRC